MRREIQPLAHRGRDGISHVFLASTTLPFQDRRNAGIVDQPMRMTFRVEDYDTRRGFRRHFRKAPSAGEGKGGEA